MTRPKVSYRKRLKMRSSHVDAQTIDVQIWDSPFGYVALRLSARGKVMKMRFSPKDARMVGRMLIEAGDS